MVRSVVQSPGPLSNWLQLVLETATARFRLGYSSLRGPEHSMHGPAHWLRVMQHATSLAEQTAGADLEVCQLFALLHDCERWNDGIDSDHGTRAAAHVRMIRETILRDLSEAQYSKLCDACAHHASGTVSADPTIGACWDADRLDLPRIGAKVDPKYLSTSAAKQRVWGSATEA
jgi:uncharacterized protein